MFNDTEWVEVDATGEHTNTKYVGRFCVKPFLTHGERADAVRLAEMYSRGIFNDPMQRGFLTTLAFLKFHVEEADADWWDSDGLSMHDEAPVYALSGEIGKLQRKINGKEEPPAIPAADETDVQAPISTPEEATILSKKTKTSDKTKKKD